MANKVYDLRAGDRVTHYKHGNGKVVRALDNGLVEVRFGECAEYVEFRNLVPTERLELEERSRREREHEAALLREGERKRSAQLEARRQANERKRAALLPVLRKWLQTDFIGSHEFYQTECAAVIPEEDFVREKRSFVRSWIAAHVKPSRAGKALLPDDEQLAAIAAVRGHVQVVARAGSGKTTTLVNRALFLMKHCAVPPGAILILAFNRNVATEVRKKLLCLMSEATEAELDQEIDRRSRDASTRGRFSRSDIVARSVDAVATAQNLVLPHVMTFHALAYAIVHPEESILYDGPDGESQGLRRVFQDVIDDHLRTPEHRDQIRSLMLAHFRQDWDRIAAGRHDRQSDRRCSPAACPSCQGGLGRRPLHPLATVPCVTAGA